MPVIHKAHNKPSIFGGTLYTTLCGRMANLSSKDGYMNCSKNWDEVTCKFCLRKTKELRITED